MCIDDFALKKREKYATIMIDIESHKIIDMIESRELNDVTEWLKSYPNLSVVSRDGSLTYKNAITKSHPSAIQISDRFHILKNLTSYCKDYLSKYLKTRVIVDELVIETKKIPPVINKNLTLRQKFNGVSKAIEEGLKKSTVCKEYHIDIRVFNKLSKFTPLERNYYFKSKKDSKLDSNRLKKVQLVSEVRASYKKIGSMRKVAKLFNISRETVKRYLDIEFSFVHGNKGIKKKSILDPYKEIIDQEIALGRTTKVIEQKIRANGFTGSSSTIRKYRANKKKLFENKYYKKNGNVIETNTKKAEYVERRKLIKLLFKKVDKVKGLTEEIVEKIYNREPCFKRIIKLVESFRAILKSKKVEKLYKWIYEANELGINEINSFINGITRDLKAVENAIRYDYNNGLAEGKINKVKVTKRIMYGRCDFELLKKKSIRLEF